jgi:hypothetical protein
MVFVVNIVSPSKNQVNIGKTTRPVDDPINLADHTESVAVTTCFHAYQNATDVGTPIVKAATIGRPFHHSERYWVLS